MNECIIFAGFWICLVFSIRYLPGKVSRFIVSILAPVSVVSYALLFCTEAPPATKLLLTFPALLYSLKAALMLVKYSEPAIKEFSMLGFLIYMTIWPGIAPQPFEKKEKSRGDLDVKRFMRGYTLLWTGIVLFTFTAYYWTSLALAPLLGLVSILLMVHLGFCDIITSLLRWWGWNVTPLFQEPWKADSLRDFWSHRWNYAFVEMNRQIFLPLFRHTFGPRIDFFLAFILSGVLHELAISFPAGTGYGGPLTYFAAQGLLCLCEGKRKYNPEASTSIWTRLRVWMAILLPAPLLFTGPFLNSIVAPLFEQTRALLTAQSPAWFLDKIIWFAAVGNFLTMLAGVQVPARLNWKDELAKLSNFNRKVILNYYFYVGGIIASWGVLTLSMHDEILRGSHLAGTVAFVITIFWAARLLVDAFYFKHSDWPTGSELVVGHTLLTTLFVFLTLAYACLTWWSFGFAQLSQF